MSDKIEKKNIRSIAVLLASNIADKFFGFLRELVVAYIFGSSVIYAGYLCLAVFVDAFMAFTGDSALQANLVPRFAKLFSADKNTSLQKIKKHALKFAAIFSAINFLLLMLYVFIHGTVPFWLILSFLLSITVGVFIFNSVGMMMLQAKGEFVNYAKGAFLNSSLAAVLIFPLSYLFGVIGLALSRLFSIASIYFVAWKNANKHQANVSSPGLTYKDFDILTLSAANFYVLILLFSKLLLSFHTNIAIAHFTYATIILGILITSIVKSISSVLLREVSVKFNLKMIYYSIFTVSIISVIFGFILYEWSIPIISIIFERGAFTSVDVIETSKILNVLIFPFMLQCITMILMQPVLSIENPIKLLFKKVVTIFFATSVALAFVLSYATNFKSLDLAIMLVYVLSIIVFIISLIAFLKIVSNASYRKTI